MKYVFNFPDIGEGITEGVIVEWKVKQGDEVKTGDPLVEMETDKVVTDIPSPRDGRVVKMYGKVGDTIEVDSPLVELEIEAAGDTASEEDEEEAFGVVGTSENAGKGDMLPSSSEGAASRQQIPRPRMKVKASPVARNYAGQLGVDIQMVEGSGPDGRVMKADILQYHEQSEGPAVKETGAPGSAGVGMPAGKDRGPGQERDKQAEEAVTEIPLSSIRKTIARNMLKSKQSAAHMSLFEEVEISELVALRQRYKEAFSEKGIKLTYLPFFLKAAARALSEYPAINSEMDMERDRLIYKKYYNIGIAVDTDDGLVVPVIRHVDRKEISQIAAEIEEKTRKARERSLTLDDFRDGTFTITSYGSIGGLWGTAVINYPQAGILGIGRIHQEPVVRDGEVAVGTVLPVSLTVDHRIVDGGTSSRFVNAFMSYVRNPADMFIR